MKTGFVLFCVVCAAVSALSFAEEGSPEYQPAATVSPAAEFSPETTMTTTAATTVATTTAATTTAATTTAATTTAATTTAATTTAATTTAATTTAATTTAATTTAATTTAATTTAATTTAATTTAATTTAATTTAATTTAATTTAATTTADTTTAATTTAATTTAPPKPTTPTSGPTTPTTLPTTAAPPTTPGPTQPTNLTAGNYSVTDVGTGATCLLCQMAVQIRRQTDAKTSFPFTVVPGDTTASGSCTGDQATLTLSFKQGAITFNFNRSKADNDVYVNSVAFNLSYPLGTASAFSQSISSLHLFNAAIGHSYSCKKDSVDMGNMLFLDVTHTRMQAFNLTQAKEFGTTDMCAEDRPDYRVAIAVGVTLLVLIIIVVIVYLIGRRQRTSGYQTL